MRMCRPCSEALQSTRTALREITGRLREDEYNMHSFPSDLRMSFMVMAEMARMMHLPGLDSDIEDLAKAVMGQVEPLHADLSQIALGVQR
ncbi:MAG: hypothetical protein PHY05_02925 [Methanothrix sp.]|nr:hypothetical protein [Methanothrix sp.]